MSHSQIRNQKQNRRYGGKGKRVLNKHLQKRHQRGGMIRVCESPPVTGVADRCPHAPDMSGYANPCNQLPLDHIWMNSFKTSGGKSRKRFSMKKRKQHNTLRRR